MSDARPAKRAGPVGRTVSSIALAFVLWSGLWLAFNAVLKQLGATPAEESQPISNIWPLAVLLIGSSALSTFAGYVTVAISRSASAIPVAALGILLLVVGIFVESQYWHLMPLWYHVTFLALLIPMCFLGRRLRLRAS